MIKKTPTIAAIRKQLAITEPSELLTLCLDLAKFKKENKELLGYLLFDSADLTQYISDIKAHNEDAFGHLNTSNYYLMKKGIRKILRNTKKYIKFTRNKQAEVELLTHFCLQMQSLSPSIFKNATLNNLYIRQQHLIVKLVDAFHEDLQYDYQQLIRQL